MMSTQLSQSVSSTLTVALTSPDPSCSSFSSVVEKADTVSLSRQKSPIQLDGKSPCRHCGCSLVKFFKSTACPFYGHVPEH